ncbi:hypothetical protein MES5069_950014 [Mesorhizobium escarrei]|uniref:Uncharacterized protein n=1 Tax=Mesorhizobium escarrei TaxID=666018 RepID=A0ABN8KHF2_9HYPH|nr:hypothetical protein MES5069_950014 [Mesorhizobium escarrei]
MRAACRQTCSSGPLAPLFASPAMMQVGAELVDARFNSEDYQRNSERKTLACAKGLDAPGISRSPQCCPVVR